MKETSGTDQLIDLLKQTKQLSCMNKAVQAHATPANAMTTPARFYAQRMHKGHQSSAVFDRGFRVLPVTVLVSTHSVAPVDQPCCAKRQGKVKSPTFMVKLTTVNVASAPVLIHPKDLLLEH